MPGKYTTNEEKVRILTWRQEKVPNKVICGGSGRGKATIMRLFAAAKELPNNIVPKRKFGGRRRGKTSVVYNRNFGDSPVEQERWSNGA